MTKFTAEQLRKTRDLLTKGPVMDESRYGEEKIIDMSVGRKRHVILSDGIIEDGRKIRVHYSDVSIEYFVPLYGAWTAEAGYVMIDEAYRIVEESKDKITARKVDSPSELESVATEIWSIERLVKKIFEKISP